MALLLASYTVKETGVVIAPAYLRILSQSVGSTAGIAVPPGVTLPKFRIVGQLGVYPSKTIADDKTKLPSARIPFLIPNAQALPTGTDAVAQSYDVLKTQQPYLTATSV